VNTTDDVFEALDMQNDIQRLYTGGTVFHAFIGESIDDAETCKRLVKKIASNYEIPYFTITPTFSVCHNHGYLKGEQFACPSCGEETRCIRVSWATTVPCRTGTSERSRNTATERSSR